LDVTTTLVEIKKLVDKAEYEIRVAKARLGNRMSEGADTARGKGGENGDKDKYGDEDADADGDRDGDGDAMDVDDAAEVKGEMERAQSIVSTRSGMLSLLKDAHFISGPTINFCIVGRHDSYSVNTNRDKTTEAKLMLQS
jgi:hypothetical protein